MMEDVDKLDPIVGNVLSAVQQVRNVISFRTRTEDVLQAFWRLQDLTHRLLAHVADGDVDCSVLSRDSPNLGSRLSWTSWATPGNRQESKFPQ